MGIPVRWLVNPHETGNHEKTMIHEISRIHYRGGYVYRIAFDDGLDGEIDFSGYIGRGPVFEPLRDIEFFRAATDRGWHDSMAKWRGRGARDTLREAGGRR